MFMVVYVLLMVPPIECHLGYQFCSLISAIPRNSYTLAQWWATSSEDEPWSLNPNCNPDPNPNPRTHPNPNRIFNCNQNKFFERKQTTENYTEIEVNKELYWARYICRLILLGRGWG